MAHKAPQDMRISASLSGLKSQMASCWAALQHQNPRVHCLTSPVAQAITANSLLAIGAEPSLTCNAVEIADFVKNTSALLINLGMLDDERRNVIPMAVETAQSLGRPFILDPVFAEASIYRRDFALQGVLQKPAILKTNQRESFLRSQALPDTVLFVSGVEDEISHKGQRIFVRGGSPLMGKTTAMGCALGGVLSALCAVEKDAVVASLTASAAFKIAGGEAGARSKGAGSFPAYFLDALSNLRSDDFLNKADIYESR